MKRNRYIYSIAALLLMGVTVSAYAQTARINIGGSVYGGGELSQVSGNTSVSITEGEISNVYGGSLGKAGTDTNDIVAQIEGVTNVTISGTTQVFGQVYGGCDLASIKNTAGAENSTSLTFSKKGNDVPTIWGDVYAGSNLGDITGSTRMVINDGIFGRDLFAGSKGSSQQSADISGNTNMVVLGGRQEIARMVKDSDIASRTVTSIQQANYLDDTNFFDGQGFIIQHNIYGGGNVSCTIAGNVNLDIRHGLLEDTRLFDLYSSVGDPYWGWGETAQTSSMFYYHSGTGQPLGSKLVAIADNLVRPQFFIFGAGYGANTSVGGNTNINVDMSYGQHEWSNLADAFKQVWNSMSDSDKLSKTNGTGDDQSEAYDRYRTYAKAHTTGMPGHTVLGIVGGGFNGSVQGNTNIDIENEHSDYLGLTCVRNIYGGGLGNPAECPDGTETSAQVGGNTNITINGGTVSGNLFGGGAGIEPTTQKQWNDVAKVIGSTTINIGEGTLIHGNVYGGGDVANVGDGTNVNITAGTLMDKVFAGGKGRYKENVVDDDRIGGVTGHTHLTISGGTIWNRIYGGAESGDVDGDTHVTITGGTIGYNVFGGGWGHVNGSSITDASVSGNTHVQISGGHMETSQMWNNETKSWYITNTQGASFTSTHPLAQYDYQSNLFRLNHNIYGGGNAASTIGGYSAVVVHKGMIDDEEFLNSQEFQTIYTLEGTPHYSIFGGGYGSNTIVKGNTYIEYAPNFNGVKQLTETKVWHAGQSGMDIVGGGFNGKVNGNTLVHVGGYAVARNVYGGSYYGDIREGTNALISSGNIDNVYAGSLMGNIEQSTANTYGLGTHAYIGLLSGEVHTDAVIDAIYSGGFKYNSSSELWNNSQIFIMNNVYGGNDVSGEVLYANTSIHGGKIMGSVYGAGNGNYRGYYDPDFCFFADGQDDNYFTATAGSKGTTRTYKFRPHTSNVSVDLAGNSETDRAYIYGQVFGGGNSTNIGNYDRDLRLTYKAGIESEITAYKTGKGYADTNCYGTTEASVMDDPEYFRGDEGSLTVTVHSHVTIGHIDQLQRNNSTGLFMGNNGQNLLTQSLDPDNAYYHRYYDAQAGKYLPGFPRYTDPDDMAKGQQMFNAYMNSILSSAKVTLTIAPDVEDVWMANFVGGGLRGSMKAFTDATGTYGFYYYLPPGVTVGGNVVGGSFNAIADYYDYSLSGNEYAINNGEYSLTTNRRYRYIGGVLGGDPGAVLTAKKALLDSPMNNSMWDWMPTGIDRKAIIRLNLNCKLEPNIVDNNGTSIAYGGNIFGGCYNSGLVEGDIWIGNSAQASGQTDARLRTMTLESLDMAASVDDDHFVLRTYGAGYGKDTEVYGDTYILVDNEVKDGVTVSVPFLYNVFGGSHEGDVFGSTHIEYYGRSGGQILGNIYGGGMHGNIYSKAKSNPVLSTRTDFNAYGNTHVEIGSGLVQKVYGGSRMADIDGGTHVYIEDNNSKNTIIAQVYGGNDISGEIKGLYPVYYLKSMTDLGNSTPTATAANKWNNLEFYDDLQTQLVQAPFSNSDRGDYQWPGVTSYVQVGGTIGAQHGFPIISHIYSGGDGSNTAKYNSDNGTSYTVPEVNSTLLEITGGTIFEAFGGGNMANVTERNHIYVNIKDKGLAEYTVSNGDMGLALAKYYMVGAPGDLYDVDDSGNFKFKSNIGRLFGGNNVADMAIQPQWHLEEGQLGSVYSGGNMGAMTYFNPSGSAANTGSGGTASNYNPKGLSITIKHENINIKSLFGGCRMADVQALNNGLSIPEKVDDASGYYFDENEFGATVNIEAGYIENVYGGNDVSGTVYHGTNVNISGAVSGNVYGSGNGNYVYQWDPSVTQVTEVMDDNKEVFYKVPVVSGLGTSTDATDVQKILTINTWRPNVEKAFLNIAGVAPDASGNGKRIAYVKGNVYCGGNASSVTSATSTFNSVKCFTKFKIGSYVTLNGVFMGSDGDTFTKEETLRKFGEKNGFALNTAIDWDNTTETGTIPAQYMPDGWGKAYYPNLLSLYMRAVEMQAQPKDFNLDLPLTEAYIGTYCGGGNRGSMLIDERVDLSFHHDIMIYNQIVGGCYNANVEYQGAVATGGFIRPLRQGITDPTKLHLTVASQFVPLVMNVPDPIKQPAEYEAAKAHNFLDLAVSNGSYDAVCNIYGGCYNSGDILGDVEIDLVGNMLKYADSSKLKATNVAETAAFNVYGGGYGMNSHIWGDVKINLINYPSDASINTGNGSATCNISGVTATDITSVKDYYPACNNIYGGGRNGYIIGNAEINVMNGTVFQHVIGGSDAGYLFGSTEIGIGYPDHFRCLTTGVYSLNRSDEWNKSTVIDSKTTTGTSGAEGSDWDYTIKQTIKLYEGDVLSTSVYDMINGVTTTDGEYHELPTNDQRNTYLQRYVRLPIVQQPDGSNTTGPLTADVWNDTDILIGEGIYGGGYAKATGSSVYAGDITVRKFTQEFRKRDPFTGNYLDNSIGFGGNTSVLVDDLTPKRRFADGVTAAEDRDHITISTPKYQQVNLPEGKDKLGYYKKEYATVNNSGKYIISSTSTGAAGEKAVYTHQSSSATAAGGETLYKFTGDGGIYGDGHLSFVEGFRMAEIRGYGYAETCPQYPKLMNCLQRVDLVRFEDNCLQLLGARDFATNSFDATTYSIARIGEMQLVSNIDETQNLINGDYITGEADMKHYNIRQRNYVGLFNNVHYLGAITSNSHFGTVPSGETRTAWLGSTDAIFHSNSGVAATDGTTYYTYKNGKITADYDGTGRHILEGGDHASSFKQRNWATARNMIGINNGYVLKIQNAYTSVDATGAVSDHVYYGPVVGVFETKLLTLTPGQGGGYVYADNVHSVNDHYMNTSGNFVFPSTKTNGMKDAEGNDVGDQYVVDDCFSWGFAAHQPEMGTVAGYNGSTITNAQDAHYWYVEGNHYYFNATITAYSYGTDQVKQTSPLEFNLANLDQIISLTSAGQNQPVYLQSVTWETEHTYADSDNDTYISDECDLTATSAEVKQRSAGLVDENKAPYILRLSVSNSSQYDGNGNATASYTYNTYGGYFDNVPRVTTDYVVAGTTPDGMQFTYDSGINNQIIGPLLAIQLEDNVSNNEGDYYTKHLSEPCKVVLKLKSFDTNNSPYYYTINLNIEYLQGPQISGYINLSGCTLPGEILELDRSAIVVKTNESMPVTASGWRLLPKTSPIYDTDGTTILDYTWQDAVNVSDAAVIKLDDVTYSDATTRNYKLPSQRYMDGMKVAYVITSANIEYPLQGSDIISIHNYHDMGDVYDYEIATDKTTSYPFSLIPLSRVYINSADDFRKFAKYIEYCNGLTQDQRKIHEAISNNTLGDAAILKNPAGAEGLKFYLQADIDLSQDASWTPIAGFMGELNGDGHVVKLPAGASALFADNGGKIYNLGVDGAAMASVNKASGEIHNSYSYAKDGSGNGIKIVTTSQGVVDNCYDLTVTDEKNFTNGQVAYNLNKYYLEKRYATEDGTLSPEHADADYQYVVDYYKNGDYQYSGVQAANGQNSVYLRTGTPNYGSTDSRHDRTHMVDQLRAVNYVASPESYDSYAPVYNQDKDGQNVNDFIFFGQTLNETATLPGAKNYNESNRVYRASGYYQSSQDEGFYYNSSNAYVSEPEITAIDFHGWNDAATFSRGTSNGIFYGPQKDSHTISGFTVADGVTRNLLVYEGDNYSSFTTYGPDAAESSIKYHHISADKKIAQFHLVDKENFWAPIAFDVTTRAWYERKPEHYALNSNSAFEGIVLPFTATKVSAARGTNDMLSHFYGSNSDAAVNGNTVNDNSGNTGHEYWLRGLTAVTVEDTQTTVTFSRPGNSDSLFDLGTGQEYASSYSFQNDFLKALYGRYSDNSVQDMSIYQGTRTFTDYPYLTKETPYIISFPGKTYREFDLSGEYQGRYTHNIWNTTAQTITFESGATTIGETDLMATSTLNSVYDHVGSFLKINAATDKFTEVETQASGIGGEQTVFSNNTEILPFRTYLTGVSGFRPAPMNQDGNTFIYLSNGLKGNGAADDEPESGLQEGAFFISVEGSYLVITSSEERTVTVYNANGQIVIRHDVHPGTTRYLIEKAGIYITNTGDKFYIHNNSN